MQPKIDAIIPAYNEAETIAKVLNNLPRAILRNIIVANNGSSDDTAKIASENGATVVDQPLKGYGNACLAGIEHLKKLQEPPNVVVFLDADFSDDPADLPAILSPILEGKADMVIGSRSLGNMEPGAMTFPQKFGNWLAPALIQLFWGIKFTDLGPFRAIRYDDLLRLEMADKNHRVFLDRLPCFRLASSAGQSQSFFPGSAKTREQWARPHGQRYAKTRCAI